MDKLEAISNREFSRRLEKEGFPIDEKAIRNLKKKQRFTVDSNNKLLWPICKEEYLKNVDLSKRRNYKEQSKNSGKSKTSPIELDKPFKNISSQIAELVGIDQATLESLPEFMQIKTLRETYLTQKDKIELLKAQENLFEKTEVDKIVIEITSKIKSSLFNLSKRAGGYISAKLKEKHDISIKPREVNIIVEEAIREELVLIVNSL